MSTTMTFSANTTASTRRTLGARASGAVPFISD
jgi:hypothetical protein